MINGGQPLIKALWQELDRVGKEYDLLLKAIDVSIEMEEELNTGHILPSGKEEEYASFQQSYKSYAQRVKETVTNCQLQINKSYLLLEDTTQSSYTEEVEDAIRETLHEYVRELSNDLNSIIKITDAFAETSDYLVSTIPNEQVMKGKPINDIMCEHSRDLNEKEPTLDSLLSTSKRRLEILNNLYELISVSTVEEMQAVNPLEEANQAVEEIGQSIRHLQKQNAELKENARSLEARIDSEAQGYRARILELENALQEKQKSMSEADSRQSNMEIEFEKLRNKCDKLEKEHSTLTADKINLEKEKNEYKRDHKRLQTINRAVMERTREALRHSDQKVAHMSEELRKKTGELRTLLGK